MLLDEMSIFLKDKLLKGEDSRYNPLLIDRFFRILTQSKELLFLGSEDEFVLTLTFFKMLESLQIEAIDIAIQNLEKGLFENLPKQIPNTQSPNQQTTKDLQSIPADSIATTFKESPPRPPNQQKLPKIR